MCSQAFILKRLDNFEAVLRTTHQLCLDAAMDDEGCPEIREQMIRLVKPFTEMVVLMLRELTNQIKDDAERKIVTNRITNLLDTNIKKARALQEERLAELPPEVKEFMDLLFRIENVPREYEISKEDIDTSMN